MADRLNGSNHFAADSLQRQVAKVSNRFSRFEEQLAERGKIVEASVAAHSSAAEVCDLCLFYSPELRDGPPPSL